MSQRCAAILRVASLRGVCTHLQLLIPVCPCAEQESGALTRGGTAPKPKVTLMTAISAALIKCCQRLPSSSPKASTRHMQNDACSTCADRAWDPTSLSVHHTMCCGACVPMILAVIDMFHVEQVCQKHLAIVLLRG